MPVRANNTFEEMLSKCLQLVSEMKQTPDADLEWIVGLETMVLSKLREPIDRMQQMSNMPSGQGAAPMPGMDPMAAMGGAPGGGMGGVGGMVGGMGTSTPGMGGPVPGAVPGVMQGSPAPNPDELRRLIGNLG